MNVLKWFRFRGHSFIFLQTELYATVYGKYNIYKFEFFRSCFTKKCVTLTVFSSGRKSRPCRKKVWQIIPWNLSKHFLGGSRKFGYTMHIQDVHVDAAAKICTPTNLPTTKYHLKRPPPNVELAECSPPFSCAQRLASRNVTSCVL